METGYEVGGEGLEGVVLPYGSETRIRSASMAKRIEETHTDFLQMITGKRAKQLVYGTWDTPGEEGI